MQDNTPTPEPLNTDGWNSDDPAVGRYTCEQVARFLTSYVAAFRALASSTTALDQVAILRMLFAHQAAIFKSGALDKEERTFAEAQMGLGLTAIGMAMVTVNTNIQPEKVLSLVAGAMKDLNEVAQTTPLVDKAVSFAVRKSGEKLEIAIRTQDATEFDAKAGATALGKAIKAINVQPVNPENN